MSENQTPNLNKVEELALPTPEQVEQVMVQKEKEASQNPGHVLDTYAGFFQVYGPVFARLIEQLGKKSLIRVMNLLIKYPIEEEHLKPMNKVEKDLFRIGHELLISKYMLILHTAGEKIAEDEAKAKLALEKKDESVQN